MDVPQKVKNRTMPASSSLYLPKGYKNTNSEGYMHFPAALFPIAKIQKEPKYSSTDEWITRMWCSLGGSSPGWPVEVGLAPALVSGPLGGWPPRWARTHTSRNLRSAAGENTAFLTSTLSYGCWEPCTWPLASGTGVRRAVFPTFHRRRIWEALTSCGCL